jgi:hypothetical protein
MDTSLTNLQHHEVERDIFILSLISTGNEMWMDKSRSPELAVRAECLLLLPELRKISFYVITNG